MLVIDELQKIYLFTKYSLFLLFLCIIYTEISTESKYTHIYWSVNYSQGYPYNSCTSFVLSTVSHYILLAIHHTITIKRDLLELLSLWQITPIIAAPII